MQELADAHLDFFDVGGADLPDKLAKCVTPGGKVAILRSGSATDGRLIDAIKNATSGLSATIDEIDADNALHFASALSDGAAAASAVVLLETDAERLSALLHAFVDRSADILAPKTSRYCCGEGLVVTTIPKSGTHLLTELLRLFGLKEGGVLPGKFAPQTWYFAGHGPHITAQQFFVSIGGLPYAGYFHPFFSAPALVLYRHPLAILVSATRYLGERENNSLNHYFQELPDDRQIDEVIDGPIFSDNFADRTNHFSPWLDMANVIPISYEEMVGAQGGGSAEAQLRLIWSLQLKLHISGSPADFSRSIEGVKTNTLRVGRIDSFKGKILDRHIQKLRSLDQDFITRFGYELDDEVSTGYLPRLVSRFRHRPLRLFKNLKLIEARERWESILSDRLEPERIVVSSQMDPTFGAECLRSDSDRAWHAETPATYPQWVELHYDRTVSVRDLVLESQVRLSERAPRDFRVSRKRQDGDEWEAVLDVRNAIYNADLTICDFAQPIECRSVRLEIYANCDGGPLLTLRKVHVHGSEPGV